MKRLIVVIVGLLFIWILKPPAKAPVTNVIDLPKFEPLYEFNISDPILRAFAKFESRYVEYAVNPITKARGIIQILPIMIDEVNRIQSIKEQFLWEYYNLPIVLSRYTWDDAFNAQKSIEMWYIVQRFKNPQYDIQKACIIWFGSGTQWDGLTWEGYFLVIQNNINPSLIMTQKITQ
jgi:hypothetical protein